jgi:uncharacterized protein YbjT (DUF2867 family)
LPESANVELVPCDLASEDAPRAIREVVEGADAVIWCASGFKPDGAAIDVDGVAAFADALPAGAGAPKLVLCSSAGVTRPAWSDAKKQKLVGAADIPIIRLNPGGILEQKAEAEARLRKSSVPYCVVRPTGLKDDWPPGRPVLSQGDVAVGRTSPSDLADVLVGVLEEPAASGKTLEMFTLSGYPSGRLTTALEALAPDAAGTPSEAAVEAAYRVLQQMLPGEEQYATKLEMGRSYEEVDRGEVARERGAAPTQRERDVAAGALSSLGGGRKPGFLRRIFGRNRGG